MFSVRLFRRHLSHLRHRFVASPTTASVCRLPWTTIPSLTSRPTLPSCCPSSRSCHATTTSPSVSPADPQFAGLRLQDASVQRFLRSIQAEHTDLIRSDQRSRAGHQRLAQLQPIIALLAAATDQRCQLAQLQSELGNERDAELLALIADEQRSFAANLQRLDHQLMAALFAMYRESECSSLIFEVSTGVGGQEAMLFASELFDMYCAYFAYCGWSAEVLQTDRTELGGLRHASAIVTGDGCFERLQFEGGVHRVQRIPATERAGRVHTSTVSVAVIPRPEELELELRAKDVRVETKRASGAGGQHVNTTDSAVRMVHLPTGVAVECQSERSQIKNRELAMQKLRAKLVQQFMAKQVAETQSTRKGQVGTAMRNEKIRTYNFNQDRITDHRLAGAGGGGGGTVHNLAGFLGGGEGLDELIGRLREARQREVIVEMIEGAK